MENESCNPPVSMLEETLMKLSENDFQLALLPYFAEVIVAENVPDAVRELRFTALRTLKAQLLFYRKQDGYVEKLLAGIAQKKGKMILSVTSKTEMSKLLHPSGPYYDGNRFIAGPYLTPEEELIAWLKAYEHVPYLRNGFQRVRELVTLISPEWAKYIYH